MADMICHKVCELLMSILNIYIPVLTDINECDDVHGCHAEATCQNTAGGYECHCNAGWTGDGRSCSGKDIFAKCLDFELLDMLIF